MLKISPSPTTGWRVEGGYAEQPFVFPTKAQAISFALVWAEKHQPCDVHIYNNAGYRQRHITFPDGNQRRATGVERRKLQVAISFPDRRRADRRNRT